jgi:hypothetical protein
VGLSGDSVDAVQSRRRVGKWIDGKQCKIVDGRLWINIPAVEEWVERWDSMAPALAPLESSRSYPKGAAKNMGGTAAHGGRPIIVLNEDTMLHQRRKTPQFGGMPKVTVWNVA